jgi:hypothetical protein
VTVKNLEASVQARLQNHARATKRPFQELLQYYAMERFLYRLSKTPHRVRFVLKGALMLRVWDAPLARATKDLDFLGRLDNSRENLERVIREVCAADVESDGMVFDPATVNTERITEDADYHVRQPRDSLRRGSDRVHPGLYRASVNTRPVDGVSEQAPEHRVPGEPLGSRDVPC